MKPTTAIRTPPDIETTFDIALPAAEAIPAESPQRDAALHTPFRNLYVYLTSGAIEVVPFAAGVTLSDTSVTVLAGEGAPVVYARSDVYLMSRELISPPAMF